VDKDTQVAVLNPEKVYPSIADYCTEKQISQATYYRRMIAGKGPKTMRVGTMRIILREDAAD
jgi:hypothetical protein